MPAGATGARTRAGDVVHRGRTRATVATRAWRTRQGRLGLVPGLDRRASSPAPTMEKRLAEGMVPRWICRRRPPVPEELPRRRDLLIVGVIARAPAGQACRPGAEPPRSR